MLDVEGAGAPRFAAGREAFARNLAERGDRGASRGVYVDGARALSLVDAVHAALR